MSDIESDSEEYESSNISSSDESDEGEGIHAETAANRQQIVVRGREPYQFEPLARAPSPNANDGDDDDGEIINEINYDERLDNTEWCSCGHCEVLPHFKAIECRCCQEVHQVEVRATEGNVECITELEDFRACFLNPLTLYIAWGHYTEKYRQNAREFGQRNNEKYRYAAYRQLVRYCWGWLGRHIRVVLPACAHAKIDLEYPDADGNYKGTILRPIE